VKLIFKFVNITNMESLLFKSEEIKIQYLFESNDNNVGLVGLAIG